MRAKWETHSIVAGGIPSKSLIRYIAAGHIVPTLVLVFYCLVHLTIPRLLLKLTTSRTTWLTTNTI
jgi:hypothetical protein